MYVCQWGLACGRAFFALLMCVYFPYKSDIPSSFAHTKKLRERHFVHIFKIRLLYTEKEYIEKNIVYIYSVGTITYYYIQYTY